MNYSAYNNMGSNTAIKRQCLCRKKRGGGGAKKFKL